MTVTITEEEFHVHNAACDGLCLACGEFTSGGVEPDASGYPCEGCDEPQVMGTEEALIAGHIEIGE